MKLWQNFFIHSVLSLSIIAMANAQINHSGGSGMPNVQSAWSLDQGYLLMDTNTRVYGTTSKPANRAAYTVWDVSGRVNFSYGLGNHVEVSASPVIYQDVNQAGNKISAPHDLFMSVKVGSFSSPSRSVAYGISGAVRIPTGDADNVAFERYSPNRVGWGLTGLLSYSGDPLYPELATNIHVNLGYWNHNDVGADLTGANEESTIPDAMSQELLYGFGLQVPKDKVSFTAEVHGNFFVQRPPRVAYSRENYMYITPGISVQPLKWVSVNLGIDLRLLESKDETSYSQDNFGIDRTLPNHQANYPGWRVNFGTTFNILPTSSYRMSEREILMQKADSRRELFEQIVREQRETESAEVELERIRGERVRAEKELERLRKILEDETQKAKQENDQKNDDKQ